MVEHDHRGHEARPCPAGYERVAVHGGEGVDHGEEPQGEHGREADDGGGQESPGVLQVEEHRGLQEVARRLRAGREHRGERSRTRRPRLRRLGERPHHDLAGVLRQRGAQLAKMGRRPRDVSREQLLGAAAERQAATQQAVGDHSQAVDVGGRRQGLPAALLWRHVGGRPDDRAERGGVARIGRRDGAGRARHRRSVRVEVWPGHRADQGLVPRGLVPGLRGAPELGEAEVQHLHGVPAPAVGLEPDIVGLQVAVQDPRAMRLFERRPRLVQDVGHPGHGELCVVAQHVGERAAVEVLHHEVRHASALGLRVAEVGDIHDVRVTQPAAGAGLALEAGEEVGPVGQVGHDHLEGHRAIGAEVHGPEHRSHPAAAEQVLDAVLAVDHRPHQTVESQPRGRGHGRESTRFSRALVRVGLLLYPHAGGWGPSTPAGAPPPGRGRPRARPGRGRSRSRPRGPRGGPWRASAGAPRSASRRRPG